MSLTIRLLGPRRIERDGEPVAGPRGNKAWALLAYLLLSRQPPSRRKLADLLFNDADDPLGALRWSLAQIRRALRQPGALRGDPVELALEPGIDVDLLRSELGSAPIFRLREIVRAAGGDRSTAVVGIAAARGQLDAGKAAIGAGAIDVGLESLRRASAAAESCGDDYLHARAQLALGSALVHAMRAYGEAAVALHKAIEVARRIRANAIAATAHRELGVVDVHAGPREPAGAWLAPAAQDAAG